MTVCGGGVSGGAAAAETSPIISWLSKQRQSEWPHRLLPVLLLLPISHFVSCSQHDVLTEKNPNRYTQIFQPKSDDTIQIPNLSRLGVIGKQNRENSEFGFGEDM